MTTAVASPSWRRMKRATSASAKASTVASATAGSRRIKGCLTGSGLVGQLQLDCDLGGRLLRSPDHHQLFAALERTRWGAEAADGVEDLGAMPVHVRVDQDVIDPPLGPEEVGAAPDRARARHLRTE